MSAAFSRRSLTVVIAVCVTSFVGGVLLMIFGRELAGIESDRFDSLSFAATGHQALYEILDEVDIPVFRSTWESGRRAGRRGVLMLLQPGIHATRDSTLSVTPYRTPPPFGLSPTPLEALEDALEQAGTTCFVLPKWTGVAHPDDTEWIDEPQLLEARFYPEILDLVGLSARLIRPEDAGALRWEMGGFGGPPTLPQVQLLQTEMLDPIISTESGLILVGEMRIDGRTAWDSVHGLTGEQNRLIVIADPDLLSNHGIVVGENAEIAVRLIEFMRLGGGVVLDETTHGHIIEPSAWRELFEFPLSLIPLHAVFCVLLLLWVGMGRFGSPKRPAPEIDPGNLYLIRNTADLLRHGGHASAVLNRYVQTAVREVRHKLHAPGNLDAKAVAAWFDRVETSRKTHGSYRRVVRDVAPLLRTPHPAPERVLRVARMVADWRQEILNGPASGQDRS